MTSSSVSPTILGDSSNSTKDISSSYICSDQIKASENSKLLKQASQPRRECVKLKKELGLWDGTGIVVGIMIGAGIFVSPGSVVKYCGSIGLSLVVWAITGVISMIGALCYAELGTMIPKSGGPYAYILEAFGPAPAFLVLWITTFIVGPAARAICLITFATYALQPLFPGCTSPPYWAVRLLALSVLWLVGYINYIGVKMGSKLQDSLTVMKLLALVVIVITGIYHLASGHIENFLNPMEGTITNPASIATAFYSSSYAYSGWMNLNNMMEELKNPNKNLPRAILISLSTVTVIYMLTNVAYFAVLTPSEILSSSAVAVTFGNRTLGVIAWIISIFVACSTFGNLNGTVMTNSRVTYAGARDGNLPKCLALIHIKNRTPVTAIFVTVLVPAFMVFVSDVGAMLTYMSFTANLLSLMCIVAFLWLRYKEPQRPRPIKVWIGFPIFYLVLCIYLTVFPVMKQPFEIAVAMVVYLAGLLVYFLATHRKVKVVGAIMDKVTYVCQMIFQGVEEEQNEKR